MVSNNQVKLLRKKLMDGKTQATAAAVAEMSERSARKWKGGPLPSGRKRDRTWRTRLDPFSGVWLAELVPLLERDEDRVLEARTVLEELERQHPGQFGEELLRTLQRRMREWRAQYGPEREVMFSQEHVPGREGAFDFTDARELGVTMEGEPFDHLLFEFVLSFSGWTWTGLAYSETFEAMSEGLQGAVWDLGGSPRVWRSDNLSAATHEIKLTGGRALTERYRALVDHYGVESTRIQPGESHENGVVEAKHGRIKGRIAQALVLRRSRNFNTVEEYEAFVRRVVSDSNRGRERKLELERGQLKALPAAPLASYTKYEPHVSPGSTIHVGKRTYSVPSRLVGHDVEVRQHASRIEVYFAKNLVETMPRIRGEKGVRIDYRHVIFSLVRKPGAFARYRYREELFPSLPFREAYDALMKRLDERRAGVEYVRILHLAASTMESRVESALRELLARHETFDYVRVRDLSAPTRPTVPVVSIGTPDLRQYDLMLGGAA